MNKGILLDNIRSFAKGNLKETTTVVKTIPVSTNEEEKPKNVHEYRAIHEKEDINEYFDTEDEIKLKVKELATLIKEAKQCIVYTGAGISTSANIPDYRSPNGIWTQAEKGVKTNRELNLEQAQPTFAHRALVALEKHGIIKYLISTNIDGLHLKSGFPKEKLSELHGNVFSERCGKCGLVYYRDFDVRPNKKGSIAEDEKRDHSTLRTCEIETCKGKLLDTIVNFGEFINPSVFEEVMKRDLNNIEAAKYAWSSDFALVIGTSLRVAPANSLPAYSFRKNGGNLVICNLQKTPFDVDAKLKIQGNADDILKLLLEELGIRLSN